MPARFCKQITPSEPGGACPSHWRRRWNVTQTADWQGGTHRGWGGGWTRWGGEWMERGIVTAKGGGWGGRGEDKKWKDRWCKGQRQGREEVRRSERGERKARKVGLFFVECPLGVAVSSQSGGLIRVRVWILSPWEANRRLIKTEVELKLDPQEDRGAQQWGEGRLRKLRCSDLAQSVPGTDSVPSSVFLQDSSSISKAEFAEFNSITTDNNYSLQ